MEDIMENAKMPKVGIVMGSDSDMPVMAKAADILEELGISYEMRVISAHREPDVGTSAGYVCGHLSHAGDWNSHAHFFFGRQGFPLFHRSDALWHSGGYGSHKRGRQRRTFGGENIGCGR